MTSIASFFARHRYTARFLTSLLTLATFGCGENGENADSSGENSTDASGENASSDSPAEETSADGNTHDDGDDAESSNVTDSMDEQDEGTSTGDESESSDDNDDGSSSGDEDGDGDLVEIPGVPCGGPSVLSLPGTLGMVTNNAIEAKSGRGFALSYPCGLRKGGKYTVVLNMHGTMPEENLRGYQHTYFPAHEYMDSHHVIVILPIAADSQWRDAADREYVLAAIEQSYAWLEGVKLEKMWVVGHSWGGYYIKTGDPAGNAGFACDSALQKYNVRGVIPLAGGPAFPTCDISIVHVTGSEDSAGLPVPDMSELAKNHGCGERMAADNIVDGSDTCEVHLYPTCDDKKVYADYLRIGKGHLEIIEPNVMKSLLDIIRDQ
jgi:pimeloyl-ACP methyl ester carboxylesterase